MSNSNSSLKELNLSVNDEIDDEGALAFAAAIDKCKSIKSLVLNNLHSISTNSWIALLKSLFNPDSVLENLYMYNNNIDGGVVTFLGGALVNNSTLKSLSLISNGSITGQGWVAFFGCLSNLNSLENLRVSGHNIDVDGMAALSNVLGNNTRLRSLALNNNQLISPAGWQAFFNGLQSCHFVLEYLNLSNNMIDDTVIPSLVIALGNSSSVSSLSLRDSRSITSAGLMVLSTLLLHPCSVKNIR